MKKKILSLAVAAGLSGVMAGAAHAAMHINDKGLGEVLVYPFYSVEGGNDTYIHVVNTTDQTKAVKVRFLEAYNSAEVLDFNLYLSPEDEWTAAISYDADTGGAKLITADTSCTVPLLGTDNPPFNGYVDSNGLKHQPFTNNQLIMDEDLASNSLDVSRTTQGYVEIFEMGQLDPTKGLGAAAVHGANKIPADCGALVDAWVDSAGAWKTSTGAELLQWGGEDIVDDNENVVPGGKPGGLWGYGVVINVEDGTTVSYDAIAIDDFNPGPGHLHYAPGTLNPNFTQATQIATIFEEGEARDFLFPGGGFDAVSALFMSANINNDYVTGAGLNAHTDWVITMPTKRNYVFPTKKDPFGQAWNKETLEACEKVVVEHWDREEGYVPPPPSYNFSPIRPGQTASDPAICTEVSVLSFGKESVESALHASGIQRSFDPAFDYGWARISFMRDKLNSTSDVGSRYIQATELVSTESGPVQGDAYRFHGLPVIGFSVLKYENGDVGGILSNYAYGIRHKSETSITVVE